MRRIRLGLAGVTALGLAVLVLPAKPAARTKLRPSSSSVETVAINLVHTLAEPGHATLHCSVGEIMDNVKAFSANISALEVN